MTVVGGNDYYRPKQCNFENISACRRNYKENSSGYILNRLSGVSLICSFVYSSMSLVV